MIYTISNKTSNVCTITLLPESNVEQTLLKQTEEQDTFMFHYQTALEKYIDPNAAFINIIDESAFPSRVVVHFQITKGIGE